MQEGGQVIAQLDMSLETTVKPLPKDSTILVRPRSALGLKYVEITKGKSTQGFADGATVPMSQATPAPVEFDDFLNTFNDPTRAAAQKQLLGFGDDRTKATTAKVAAHLRNETKRARPVAAFGNLDEGIV